MGILEERRLPDEPADSREPAGTGGEPWTEDEFGYPPLPGEIEGIEPERPRRFPRRRLFKWAVYAFFVFLVLLIGWLAIAAPVSRTARPLVPPEIVLTASDGTPIARMGAIMDRPVVIDELPPHVTQAFLAIEDRRFEDHWGIDPQGIARALWTNIRSDERQGGSTITQQLAKLTYLNSERSIVRKIQEVPIALWLEIWLSKDQILERYLSNVYFGDNVYGLRAASLHYFYRRPEKLTLTQAAMLAGLMKAPSRLAPTRNLEAAQARELLVLQAMVDAGYLTAAQARAVPLATVDHRPDGNLPRGSYFADWALSAARTTAAEVGYDGYASREIRTTLDRQLQALAERVARNGAPAGAQVALIAMRPNGEVVAMVGGRDYSQSAFNRVTQAERQPGSTFKLIVYLAALRSGMTADTMVDDSPITTGGYRPNNAGGRYRGRITLREAFAKSSNVVAVKLYQQLGPLAIAEAAESLGIHREFPENATVALGSADLNLLELTAAYAAIAGDASPVVPHAIALPEQGFFERWFNGSGTITNRRRNQLRELLAEAVNSGTGTAARLAIPSFGKTGTTQDSRDALFVGFAGDLVVGVWIGNDNNAPLGNASGGGAPARIWRDFMIGAVPGSAPRVRPPPPEPETPLPEDELGPAIIYDPETGLEIKTDLGGGRFTLDDDDLGFEPDEQTRRELEELERLPEQFGQPSDEEEEGR